MKYKTTKTAINNGYYYKICVGYCDMQHLLNFENANAYTCGVYGWNADIYDIGDIIPWNACIVTGYRPFGNIRIDYDKLRKAEKAAEKIQYDYKTDWNKRKAKVRRILVKLLTETIEEYKKETEDK